MKRISLLLCILFGASLIVNIVCSDEQPNDDEYTVDESDEGEDETTKETEDPEEVNADALQQNGASISTSTPNTQTQPSSPETETIPAVTIPAASAAEEKKPTAATDTQAAKSTAENQNPAPSTQNSSSSETAPTEADRTDQETENTTDRLTGSKSPEQNPEAKTDAATESTEASASTPSSTHSSETAPTNTQIDWPTTASQAQTISEQPTTPTETEQQEAVTLSAPLEQKTVAETPQLALATPRAAPVTAPNPPLISSWTGDFNLSPGKPQSISAQEIANQTRALSSSQIPTLEQEPENTVLTGPLTGKSLKQAMTHLAPLVMTRSVEKAVEQFTNLPADRALEILEHLIKTSRIDFSKKGSGRPFEIKRNDFLQIIFGVASQYRDPALYRSFFNLIDQYPGLEHGMRPILFILSISSYPVLIPDLINWLEDKEHTNCIEETARYAIDRTSGRSLRALASYVPVLLKPLLGSLLLYAISEKKPRVIISALINAGANVNYPDASGYTPLIKAVEMGDLAITRLLMSNGGDSDLVVQDEIGSAWQKASELHNELITQYLEAQYAKQPKRVLRKSSFSDIREPTAH